MLVLVSPAFAALIWWVLPAGVLLLGIVYVLWITKYKGKYEAETNRSVKKFNQFQNTFRRD